MGIKNVPVKPVEEVKLPEKEDSIQDVEKAFEDDEDSNKNEQQ